MTDEYDNEPAPAPVPKITAPLPPGSAQHLTESTSASYDVAQVTRPPWPKLNAHEPEPGFPRGKRQCIGRSTRTGKRCGGVPCVGKERCKFHGGRSTGRPRKNAASTDRAERGPRVGRYHESMGKLAEVYESARGDASLTDTREPLAALDAYTRKALARAADNDVPEFRRAVLEAAAEVDASLASGDLASVQRSVASLRELAQRGAQADDSDAVALSALRTFSERVDAYWKTKLDRKQAINSRDLVMILQRVVDLAQAELSGEAAGRFAKAVDALLLSPSRYDRDKVGTLGDAREIAALEPAPGPAPE